MFNLGYVTCRAPDYRPRTLDEIRNDVLVFNQQLFDEILQQNSGFDQVITMIGSNRQSWELDERNRGFGKGSCFPAIEAVTKKLNATFDSFLLADVDCARESGIAFELAMFALNNPGTPLIDCGIGEDEHLSVSNNYVMTKIALLYVQMHRQACEHPEDSISFDFYDDREDILDDLAYFFHRYPDLIPKNMTLTLHQYAGGATCKTLSVISASADAIIDSNYQDDSYSLCLKCIKTQKISENIDVLVRDQTLDDEVARWRDSRRPLTTEVAVLLPAEPLPSTEVTGSPNAMSPIPEEIHSVEGTTHVTGDIDDDVLSELVNDALAERGDAVSHQVENNFINVEITSSPEYHALGVAMKELMQYGDTLQRQGATEKAELVRTHATRLTHMLNDFFNAPQNLKSFQAFKPKFIDALHAEDKKMNLPRAQWKPILANIALALTVVGALFMAGYACYGLVSSKINKEPVTLSRCMLFFSTNSMRRVDEVGAKFKQCANIIK